MGREAVVTEVFLVCKAEGYSTCVITETAVFLLLFSYYRLGAITDVFLIRGRVKTIAMSRHCVRLGQHWRTLCLMLFVTSPTTVLN